MENRRTIRCLYYLFEIVFWGMTFILILFPDLYIAQNAIWKFVHVACYIGTVITMEQSKRSKAVLIGALILIVVVYRFIL